MQKFRVAVIDDDGLIRRFVATTMLRVSCTDVVSFEDGSAAWEWMQFNPEFDIVISDVEMPGMNGIELLGRIRERFPDKVCIIISSNRYYKAAALASGANGFLEKPFSVHDLLDTVKPHITEYGALGTDAS